MGFGGVQLIRLIRSLVLTRMLFPEAFGLMAIVWVVMYALEMLSDVGLASALIRDRRGDDPIFLNTAWSMQVIRGALLCVLATALASPLARVYAEPQLVHLITVVGVTALIGGFNSTALYTLRRRMQFERLSIFEVSNEAVALIATVLWASVSPSVWALVGGALVSRTCFMLGSHAFLPGIRNRFHFETSSVQTLVGFGKWIYLSSALYFLSAQSDRLLMGLYLDVGLLGVYSIAVTLSESANNLVGRINSGVLLPAYGNVFRDDPSRLRPAYIRARFGIDAFLIAPIAAVMICGQRLVSVLYDARYEQAGWMFQILCVRLLMTASLGSSEACLVALGRPQYAFLQNVGRAAWILIGIPIGWHVWGVKGVVWAVALSELPALGVLWLGLRRHEVFSYLIELRSLSFAALGMLLGAVLLRIVG